VIGRAGRAFPRPPPVRAAARDGAQELAESAGRYQAPSARSEVYAPRAQRTRASAAGSSSLRRLRSSASAFRPAGQLGSAASGAGYVSEPQCDQQGEQEHNHEKQARLEFTRFR
jgi:hypothetical protein